MVPCCFQSQLESVWTGLETTRGGLDPTFVDFLAIFGYFLPFLTHFWANFGHFYERPIRTQYILSAGRDPRAQSSISVKDFVQKFRGVEGGVYT